METHVWTLQNQAPVAGPHFVDSAQYDHLLEADLVDGSPNGNYTFIQLVTVRLFSMMEGEKFTR